MAQSVRHIKQAEWDVHENTIKDLYYRENLPLQSKKERTRTLIKVMEDEHGFLASSAQYEAQFRKWGMAKNLGKREWQKLLWEYEEVESPNRDARIVISGTVVEESKQKRMRRRYEPEQHMGYTIPAERKAYVEFREAGGPWLPYSDAEPAAELLEFTPNSVGQNSPVQFGGDTLVSTSPEALLTRSLHEFGEQLMTPGMELVSPPAISPTSTDDFWGLDNGHSFHNHHFPTPQEMLQHQSPFPWDGSYFNLSEIAGHPIIGSFFDEAAVGNTPNASLLEPGLLPRISNFENAVLEQWYPEVMNISVHRNLSANQDFQTRPRRVAESLVQRSRQMFGDNIALFKKTQLPDVEDVIDRLESLLPENIELETTKPDSEIIERNASFGAGFKTLLYSIMNGFAGLRDIPPSSILKLIREDHQAQSYIFKLLNTTPSGIAKSLGDNLFRAAVESCDLQAVVIIMSITGKRPEIAIDPNTIVCKFEGRDYTPVELAAKFRNIEIVRALLAANADPNKTYFEQPQVECGALELAVRKWGKLERLDLELVKLLLSCGAEIRIDLVEAVVRWGPDNMELFGLLMNEIPITQHPAIFESESILTETIEYLDNEAAKGIVQSFFDACISTNCGKCASKYPGLLKGMLAKAAHRGNLDLVKFLSPYTEDKQLALASAVRSGKSEIISFLLVKGATVDGPGEYLNTYGSDKYSPRLRLIVTPLAEAVRAQDDSQVQEFERRGALACIAQIDHFEAAVFAAAEAGDDVYLQKVLRLVHDYRRYNLTPALTIAIRNDHTETALSLLDVGAGVNYNMLRGDSHNSGFPLLEALQRRNKRVVDVILESDFAPTAHSGSHERDYFMEIAAEWGDMGIINDLALMGVSLDAGRQKTALTTAVMDRNKPLARHLLQLGAKANARSNFGLSPLQAAVENGDNDMMAFLFSHGASVLDAKAVRYAAKHNPSAYDMLLSAFKRLSQTERKGFGGDILADAIHQDDFEAINTLLKAEVDINNVSSTPGIKLNMSPFGVAVRHKKGTAHALVRNLLQAGGDPNSIAAKSRHPNVIPMLQTPLHLAIQTRNEEMADILIKAGALVNRPARRGIKRTPLQEACKISSFKMVQLLLLHGANVNAPAPERNGHTALQLTAITGSIKIARLLLDNGADPHAAPSKVNGRTAFEGAAEEGCLDMLHLLWRAVSPKPFDQKELQQAREYAETRGQRACVDYIDSLLDASNGNVAAVLP